MPLRASVSIAVALILGMLAGAPAWAQVAGPKTLTVRLALAKKSEKDELPATLRDVAADLKRLGYNSATLLSSQALDTGKANARKIPIEGSFSVTVSVKPPEDGKVPVVVDWEKGKQHNRVSARVREPFISGGGAHKDGTLLLILTAR